MVIIRIENVYFSAVLRDLFISFRIVELSQMLIQLNMFDVTATVGKTVFQDGYQDVRMSNEQQNVIGTLQTCLYTQFNSIQFI